MSSTEPMKQRFKKFHPWKLPHEIIFADDFSELARSGLELKRLRRNKRHGHAWGRKPAWRARRRLRRQFRQKERFIVKSVVQS